MKIDYGSSNKKICNPKFLKESGQAVFNQFENSIEKQVRGSLCLEHGLHPTVEVEGHNVDKIELELSGCCQQHYVPVKEAGELLKKGSDALAQGNTLSALSCFEKAVNIDDSPIISSYYAFCIAKARGQVLRAISLCEEAIKKDPKNSLHYLNLGRIYLITNNREDAIKTFREGLNYEANQQIVDELNRLVTREPSIFPFLKRSNPINKYLEIILRNNKRLRIRYTLMTLLLAVTVAFILLVLLIPDKQKILAPRPGEYRKENLVEVKHDTAHTLELIAGDKTWVFVKIDDGESREVLLNQGEHIKWSAKNDFSLKIGNAGGIKMIFDGKEVGPLGEKGQVLSLKLPSPKVSKRDTLGSTIES